MEQTYSDCLLGRVIIVPDPVDTVFEGMNNVNIKIRMRVGICLECPKNIKIRMGVGICLERPQSTSECQFKSWLHCFQSSFLLIHPKRQQNLVQVPEFLQLEELCMVLPSEWPSSGYHGHRKMNQHMVQNSLSPTSISAFQVTGK